MKLFKTIVLYDVCVVADGHEAARQAVKDWIATGELPPSEEVALEIRDENNIRDAWKSQKPLVGADISDQDFEKRVKGRTTIELFQHIYTKRG